MSAPLLSRILATMRRWVSRERRRRLSEAGYAAVMVAVVVPTIGIGCAAVAVDTGMWYVEIQQVQKAADAAALAGVPYLPQDLPSARARALEVAARNGYGNNGNNTVTVSLGEKATQLRVEIRSTITNTFGTVIGVPTQTITRGATADYQGPAPMGSPCNTFGNEPNAGNRGVVTPVGTAQGSTPPTGCTRNPQLWATVFGPDTDKISGDRYQTELCANGTAIDGCDSSKNNLDYDEFGYVFVVKVDAAAVNTQVNLQLYDPMYVNTGTVCEKLPPATDFPVNTTTAQNTNVNSWVQNKDAVNRYTRDGAYTGYIPGDGYIKYCSGDNAGQSVGTAATTTSFVLREQTDTQNPKIAPVQTDTGGSPCIKQFGTYNASGSSISSNVFKSGATGYNAEVAETFHNWVSLCTFTPTRAGNYYLQVRTNVSMGGSGGTLIKSGNANAAKDEGNTTSGAGENMFAARAVTASGKETAVAVSGYNHMPIYVNADTATAQFHLIRVLPGAAGQKISFSYFDAGDATGDGGSVRVQVPPDATGTVTTNPFPGGCTAYGGSAGGSQTSQTTYNNCTAPFVKVSGTSKNNGKVETITIPIPTDYTCNFASYSGCWYRVTLAFNLGGVSDVTTWDATILGDPVRLIQ
jgi:Flp pilus assembly protein TadG